MGIWTEHRAATIASMIGFVAIVGVGGWLLLRSPSNASQPSTTTSTTSASHPAPQTTDWPTYGLDAARTRYLPSDRVQPPYKVAWSYDARHLMEYSPIVVGETLYGIDNNGEAFALNTRNGKPALAPRRRHAECVGPHLRQRPALRLEPGAGPGAGAQRTERQGRLAPSAPGPD